MRKSLLIILLAATAFAIKGQTNSSNKAETGNYDQVRLTAIQNFSKTKLFKMDSVFYVTLYDTLRRMDLQRVDQHNAKWVVGKAYPDIIAVDILGDTFKYLLDTTATIDMQNDKAIPTRVVETNGRLFIWRSTKYPLTDSTVRILEKFHLIVRGRKSDLYKLLDGGTDDSKKAATYYFCRTNLSVYKRVITNVATGYYDPPNITCNSSR